MLDVSTSIYKLVPSHPVGFRPIDASIQDQIIIFMVLAEGTSVVKTGPLTLHTKTAIYVAEELTDARFSVAEETSGGTVIVKCQGIGYRCDT